MQWRKAQFKLQDGTKFTIAHALPLEGINSIDIAFETWCDTHLAVDGIGTDPKGDFIRYINAHTKPDIKAYTVEAFEALKSTFTDTSLMPFGQHKGKKLIDVPASYLLYMYDKGYVNNEALKKYIADNLTVLKAQSKAIKN